MAIKAEISEALKRVIHGVYVISTRHEGKVNAMTAAWVARASFEPPLITVAVGRERHTHAMIEASKVFAVNALSPDRIPTGKHFGLKSGKRTDKFAGIDFDTASTGAPILKDCIAWMDCKVFSSVEAGDHTIFIGEVIDAGVREPEKKTLIYDRESFYR